MRTLAKRGGVLSDFRIFKTNRFVDDLEGIGKNKKIKIYDRIRNYIHPQLKNNPCCLRETNHGTTHDEDIE